MRREAEARTAERARVFARLRELSPVFVEAPRTRPEIVLQPLADEVRVWRANRIFGLQRLPMVQEENDDDGEADVNAPAEPRFVIAHRTFDRYVFGSLGGPESARILIESLQSQRIDSLVRQHRLSPDQKDKLVLAARGDVKRLYDGIDDARRQFELLRTDVDRCRRFLQTLQPLQHTLRLELDSESLVAKTLKKIVESDDDGARRPK